MANSLLVLQILEILGEGEPLGVSDLARSADASKSSTHRALQDLAASGWVYDVGRETRRWALTPKLLVVAAGVGAELGIRNCAIDDMERLRDEFGETVHLAVPDGHEMVLIERFDSPEPIRFVLSLGTRSAMHRTATGLAYLAALPEGERAELVSKCLSHSPKEAKQPASEIHAAIGQVVEQGYALNEAGYRHDIAAVAASIVDATGRPAASLAVSVPRQRAEEVGVAGMGPRVLEAAASISAKLGGRVSAPAPRASASRPGSR